MMDKKKEMEKGLTFTLTESEAKLLELLAADYLAARGYAVFDGGIASQMLGIVAEHAKNS